MEVNNMEVNVYCSKELFILEVAGVLHTPLLPEKITGSRFLLLFCDVEKCMWNIHWTSIYILKMSEIIGFPVLNLAFYNNSRSNSEVFSSMKQFNSARKTCEGVQFLVTLQACCKFSKVGPVLNSFT